MIHLSSHQKQALKAQAHGIKPVVSISSNGLTASVLKEIDICLNAHELIKIRVYSTDRESREGFLNEICNTLSAVLIQHIGKLLVIWRPNPEKTTLELPNQPRLSGRQQFHSKSVRRTKRSFQG